MDKIVKIECEGKTEIDISELEIFQGDLKDLTEENYNKLKNEILEDGFSEPVSVWKHEGKNYILNGTQRFRTLTKMKQDGYTIPAIPINLIRAKDIKQASRKCLALTSQYGTMTADGLLEFTQKYELDIENVKVSFRFPEINLDNFDFSEEKKETKEKQYEEGFEVIIECNNEIEQKQLYDRFINEGLKCRVLIL